VGGRCIGQTHCRGKDTRSVRDEYIFIHQGKKHFNPKKTYVSGPGQARDRAVVAAQSPLPPGDAATRGGAEGVEFLQYWVAEK